MKINSNQDFIFAYVSVDINHHPRRSRGSMGEGSNASGSAGAPPEGDNAP